MSTHAYPDATALRVALEVRLRQRALESGVPLDRLRKEVAHQRLLARLAASSPGGSWALKGGMALLARLEGDARATKDTDATWRVALEDFDDALEAAVTLDLGDEFVFEVGLPKPLAAETGEGGRRYSVRALLDGREFERLQLDVNAVPNDPRPIEYIRLRDLLGFAAIPAPTVPVISPCQHLAEKLHAFARHYNTGGSDRPQDLYDMLVIARSVPLPSAGELVAGCRQTFALRRTDWPPVLPSPPTDWGPRWQTYIQDHDVPWRSLREASEALAVFWQPLIHGEVNPGLSWDGIHWRWLGT